MDYQKNYHRLWSISIDQYMNDNGYSLFNKIFLAKFENKYKKVINKYKFSSYCQLNEGNRIRPRIILLMYLYDKFTDKFPQNLMFEVDRIIDICISVELIHKASLIMDDLIDGDITRKGQPCFHNVHGAEATNVLCITLISDSLKILHESLNNLSFNEQMINKILGLSLRTIQSMSFCALKELQLTSKTIFDLNIAKEIINGEVSSLFNYSFLMGYYLINRSDPLVEKNLLEIGETIGIFFQLLNDLEPFYNTDMTVNHKTKAKFDFTNNQKSMVTAYLGEFLSKKELQSFAALSDPTEKYNFIMNKVQKYDLMNFINGQKDLLKSKLIYQCENLECTDSRWKSHFIGIVNLMIKAGEDRLK